MWAGYVHIILVAFKSRPLTSAPSCHYGHALAHRSFGWPNRIVTSFHRIQQTCWIEHPSLPGSDLHLGHIEKQHGDQMEKCGAILRLTSWGHNCSEVLSISSWSHLGIWNLSWLEFWRRIGMCWCILFSTRLELTQGTFHRPVPFGPSLHEELSAGVRQHPEPVVLKQPPPQYQKNTLEEVYTSSWVRIRFFPSTTTHPRTVR